MRVTHIITNLAVGGAEAMLYRLLTQTDRTAFEPQVICLVKLGIWGRKLQELGVPVRVLGMRPGKPNPLSVLKLARWLRSDPPHVLQTWMYHSNLIGGLAANLAGGFPTVWGVHSSGLDAQSTKRSTLWTARACTWSSHWLPTRIVCCSDTSRRVHENSGYPLEKLQVIYNGFDLVAFRPNPSARLSVRQELGISEAAPLIGLVGRFDAPKDHQNFIRAAALLRARMPDVNFLLCGEEISWRNKTLVRWIEAAGIGDCSHLMGLRQDVPRITAALDIASLSSSYGEAFPLVIGEAMACGVPCVATDVGDSAAIIGKTGRVVPAKNPEALAEAWHELLALGLDRRSRLGAAARQRIEKSFTLPNIVLQYEELYEELACHANSRSTKNLVLTK